MKSATGSIRERKNKSGTKWQVTIELGNDDRGIRKRNSFSCNTREEADIMLHKKIAEANDGTSVLNNSTKVKEYLNEWLEDYVKPYRSATTYCTYKKSVINYLIPCFGNFRLQELKTSTIQKHYNQWQKHSLYNDKPLAAESIRCIHRVFESALNQALKLELIHSNPIRNVILPKRVRNEKDFFDQDEIREILELAKGTFDYLFLLVCFSTGGRRGEVAAMRWKNVDWKKHTIFIDKSFVEGEGEIVFKDPKSATSIRTIPIPDSVMKELKIGYMHYKERQLRGGKDFKNNGFIFCKENGEPYRPHTIAQRYERFMKRNGFRHIKFHNTRVSLVSVLSYNNVSPKTIQSILGHASIGMTMDVYAQRVSAEMDEVSALMDDKIYAKIGKQQGLNRVV